MGLFHRLVKKLGVEGALEQSIELSPQVKVKYKTGRVLMSLIYALVLDLNYLSDALLPFNLSVPNLHNIAILVGYGLLRFKSAQ